MYYELKYYIIQLIELSMSLNFKEYEDFIEIINIFKNSKNIYTIGAGTAAYAGDQVCYYLRNIAHRNAISIILRNASNRQTWDYAPVMRCSKISLISRRNMTNACQIWMLYCQMWKILRRTCFLRLVNSSTWQSPGQLFVAQVLKKFNL